MNIKNLVFASASFHPKRINFIYKKKDYLQREEDYFFCLKQLVRVTPQNFEIYIVVQMCYYIQQDVDYITCNYHQLPVNYHIYLYQNLSFIK